MAVSDEDGRLSCTAINQHGDCTGISGTPVLRWQSRTLNQRVQGVLRVPTGQFQLQRVPVGGEWGMRCAPRYGCRHFSIRQFFFPAPFPKRFKWTWRRSLPHPSMPSDLGGFGPPPCLAGVVPLCFVFECFRATVTGSRPAGDAKTSNLSHFLVLVERARKRLFPEVIFGSIFTSL